MRFSANISLLFGERPFLDRFEAAASAGIQAVEFFWPTDADLPEIPARVDAAGVDVALFNFLAGDMAGGDRGLLSDPGRAGQFRENVPLALDLATALNCTRINALVGTALPGLAAEEQLAFAVENVRWAADHAAPRGIQVMIEAINTFENGPYLLAHTDDALEFIDAVGRGNVRLQYDAYHMQRMEGNIVATLRRVIDRIGHVQIADSPDRHEPGTGEIAFSYVLDQLQELGYGGYVGLEYRPSARAEESLGWLRDYTSRREQSEARRR